MNAKKTDLKELEGWYEKSGNQLMLLYGGMDCRKEQLIKEFCVGKKYFYYRCRQLSAQEQMQKMGEEIQNAFQMKLSRYSYDEFFNRVKSGDASKLVIVIDEAQYAIKRDPEFVKSILKLKIDDNLKTVSDDLVKDFKNETSQFDENLKQKLQKLSSRLASIQNNFKSQGISGLENSVSLK